MHSIFFLFISVYLRGNQCRFFYEQTLNCRCGILVELKGLNKMSRGSVPVLDDNKKDLENKKK